MYFARLRVDGKLIRASLKTNTLSVAVLRLADRTKEERQRAEGQEAVALGKMTFHDAMEVFRSRLESDQSIKPRTVEYRKERMAALLKSWPDLEKMDVAKISKTDCLNWAKRFSTAAPSNFNNTVGTLKMIIDVAIEAGARYNNPAGEIKKMRVRPKRLTLPDQAQFLKFVHAMRDSGVGFCHQAADLVEFLAYGGFRLGEAARITWEHCDFEKGEILVLGDPETGTKNWAIRRVPMIPDMRRHLEGIRASRKVTQPTDRVMPVKECQITMTRVAKEIGMTRITHHDLRHLFATRCIESGVDVPTVSRWLGHKDGGALAMKTYGHLRDAHSTEMAQKVFFSVPSQENVVPMPKEGAA